MDWGFSCRCHLQMNGKRASATTGDALRVDGGVVDIIYGCICVAANEPDVHKRQPLAERHPQEPKLLCKSRARWLSVRTRSRRPRWQLIRQP